MDARERSIVDFRAVSTLLQTKLVGQSVYGDAKKYRTDKKLRRIESVPGVLALMQNLREPIALADFGFRVFQKPRF